MSPGIPATRPEEHLEAGDGEAKEPVGASLEELPDTRRQDLDQRNVLLSGKPILYIYNIIHIHIYNIIYIYIL